MAGRTPTQTECDLAALAIAVLRDAEIPTDDILCHYTREAPQADRAREEQYLAEYGEIIAVPRIKAQMRRMLIS